MYKSLSCQFIDQSFCSHLQIIIREVSQSAGSDRYKKNTLIGPDYSIWRPKLSPHLDNGHNWNEADAGQSEDLPGM